MKVQINKFNPDTIKPYRIIMFIGKRGSGKSFLITDILYCLRKSFDFGIGMTPTAESAESMEKIMPASSIYNEYSALGVERMVKYQKERGKAKKAQRHVLLLLDDCMYDKATLRSTVIRDLYERPALQDYVHVRVPISHGRSPRFALPGRLRFCAQRVNHGQQG